MAYFVVESAETYKLGKNAPFVKWLEFEGFQGRVIGGHYGGGTCKPWVFIDIDVKEFVYGVWGAQAAGPVVGKTHLTIEEFKTIYAVMQKSRERMKAIPGWADR